MAAPPGADIDALEANLAEAKANWQSHPEDPARIVWYGRRLGYLWRMNDAIAVFSDGIRRFPDYAPLYRHRGHRYISVRRFDDAVVDLEKAATLIANKPDEIEQDGIPNARNIPLTTTAFNVWYHLGVARYFQGEYDKALIAFVNCKNFTRALDDNVVAVADWTYLTLRRLGRHDEAIAALQPIKPTMDIVENQAYHRRTLMYKGLLEPDDLLRDQSNALDYATLGYGVGYQFLHTGQLPKAMSVFRQVVDGPYWPAFGYIASEVELAREHQRTTPMPYQKADRTPLLGRVAHAKP